MVFILSEITIINHKKPASISGNLSTKIASNYFSKDPNGDQALRQLDSLKHWLTIQSMHAINHKQLNKNYTFMLRFKASPWQKKISYAYS